ncbi:MAG: Ig-like domain-containing protein, partial [Bacteroidales bacterium]|nr:Ig-like domain-containing protein [Bacteroidales bacterium]
FVDTIALQTLADAGNGVLAHAINEESVLVVDKGGSSATTRDTRYAPRSVPDIGAYEFIANQPMTGITILNENKDLFIHTPVRIAVQFTPTYTTENYSLSIDASSTAEALLNGDTLLATKAGKVKVRAINNENNAISDSIEFKIDDEFSIQSINLSLATTYTSILPGDQLQFYTNVLPKNGVDTTVTWSVSSPGIASISEDGLLSAMASGTVTVYATSNEDETIYEQLEITVLDEIIREININNSFAYKTGIEKPCGAVMCWLTDSDTERTRERTMETSLREMNAGMLRFPYGHLSNNYIWTKDPENTTDGLNPFVPVPSVTPGTMDWAVDEDGYFKNDMDFDEYVALCQNIGAEPVVCVNIMSHVYDSDDHITIDTLIYYAKEWVRYANVTKGYNIKYWQLGNEQDHHWDIYSLDAFKEDYKKMALAMKEIDADIKTAPGLLQNWNDVFLADCPELVDYVTCHQYLFGEGSDTEAYSAWKDYGHDLIPNVTKNQNFVTSSNNPKLEILVTETGITGGSFPDPQSFNLYKALLLFEMQMELITTANVKSTFFWGTHTPWNGAYGDSPLSTLFTNDEANENKL